ncbi:MAG: hypothetical protein K2H67_03310, partial [Treponemataceae bacterium]|nr:hypothetical protein [Treponemataceae bacterium]
SNYIMIKNYCQVGKYWLLQTIESDIDNNPTLKLNFSNSIQESSFDDVGIELPYKVLFDITDNKPCFYIEFTSNEPISYDGTTKVELAFDNIEINNNAITFNCKFKLESSITVNDSNTSQEYTLDAKEYNITIDSSIFNIDESTTTYLIYNSGNDEITTTPYTDTSKFGLYYLTYQSDDPVWVTKNFKDFTKYDITEIKATLQNLQENGIVLNDIILDKKDGDNYSVIGLNSENPYYKIPIESDLMFEALEKESIDAVSIEKFARGFALHRNLFFPQANRNFSSCLFFRISLYFKNNKDSKLKMAHRFCAVFKS